MEEWGRYRLIGKTRDDAAGEALDKVSKLLRLGYPGGPAIERLSAGYEDEAFPFQRPRFSDGSLDFSFSGLKTQALRHFQSLNLEPRWRPDEAPKEVLDLAASFQKGVIETLYGNVFDVASRSQARSILVCGGVSRNGLLRKRFSEGAGEGGLAVFFPEPQYTTDNAAMIAWVGYRYLSKGASPSLSALTVNADANLNIGEVS